MKKIYFGLIALLAMSLIGCNDDDNDNTVNVEDIRLVNDDQFGQILVDADGNTLYFFSDDHTGTTSECTGGCLDAWPIFYAANPTLGTGLTASDFGTVEHPNGEMMTTYKGWPLYYFANDNAPGDVNGDGAGNVWYVAKPDYDVMYVRAQLRGRNSSGTETDLIVENNLDYVAGTGETFYIVDDRGNTLYGFIPDTFENNTFTAEDFSNNSVWPIAEFAADVVPSVLDADDFNTIDVFGRTQLTYKGWPLYYFGQDEDRGDNFGVGFPANGIWPVLNPSVPVLANADVELAQNSTFGDILVDSEGNTLYFFSDDYTGTTSECTGGCLNAWPIFHEENLTVGNGLDADDFGTIMHPNGEMMTTYKGWPLYYFANDNAAGDVNGDGAGNVWYVAKPDYDVMYVRAQLIGRDSDGNETNLVIDNGAYVAGNGETFYIVDDRGNTLYAFAPDTANTNTYTEDNDPNSDRNMLWPVTQIDAMVVPSILDADDFGTIDVFGWTQMTYKNRPIYYFGQDENRGDNFGVGFPTVDIWPIVNTDTTVL